MSKRTAYPNLLNKLKMQIKRLHRDAKLPTRATLGSGGLDLHACEDAVIGAGATCKFPLGFALYIEDPKMAGLILPRSGLGTKHGIVCLLYTSDAADE